MSARCVNFVKQSIFQFRMMKLDNIYLCDRNVILILNFYRKAAVKKICLVYISHYSVIQYSSSTKETLILCSYFHLLLPESSLVDKCNQTSLTVSENTFKRKLNLFCV